MSVHDDWHWAAMTVDDLGKFLFARLGVRDKVRGGHCAGCDGSLRYVREWLASQDDDVCRAWAWVFDDAGRDIGCDCEVLQCVVVR